MRKSTIPNLWLVIALLVGGFIHFNAALAPAQQSPLGRQSRAEVERKSKGCLVCHGKMENRNMHQNTAITLGCTDCHGGNAEATTVRDGHVKPRNSGEWKTSANPVHSYTLLNKESPEFLKFVNPGDLRVADETCGPCHAKQVMEVKKSMMTTSPLLWGGAAYNNGIVSTKNYILGESYSRDGYPQQIFTVPTAEELKLTADELKAKWKMKGILPTFLPLPRWEITQPGDYYRSFERGGKDFRGNPSEIGIPNPFNEPGKPDNKLGDRGKGTQTFISSPVLNLQKTRLNDPHLSFMGTNDHPGDYRSSGCTACHTVYANDRSIVHSGPYAKFGNRGFSQTADTTISKTESGHPLKHVFTKSIPSSQCMVCHMHQPNAFMNTFFGYQMWDYETDGEGMYPAKQKFPSNAEMFKLLKSNPEEAVLRGNWGDLDFLTKVSEANPQRKNSQFSDYHGHGWVFRAVFSKDRKGHLLDKDGKIIPSNSEHKFHGVVPLEDREKGYCNEECRKAQKAVHLNDIHAEKGMHCVDCHFSQDNHGTGKLVGEFHNAIEITCIDCHGTVTAAATLRTSGIAAPPGGTNLETLITPFPSGENRFERRGNRIIQRSMLHEDLQWEIPQVKDIVDPQSSHYNAKARTAKLMGKDGLVMDPASPGAQLAHTNEKMECYTCHTSWITNCFGCHLPQQANWKKDMNHYEGETSRNWTTYNPQVLRDEGFMLCINGSTKGNKVATARSSSALILSSKNANREQIYLQQAPISAPGYSSQAFNPHFAHTVRTKETRVCTDCHLSSANDNNAWMAQVLLQGTNLVNFIGKYAYVGMGTHGFEAVQVTVDEEPQAVIGSYLHRLAYPDYYKKHLDGGKKLETAYHHSGKNILSLSLRGEYLYTASGTGGFRVYDVANVDNKGFSERVVTSPVSAFGQDTHVSTRYATAVALPTNMPVDTRRVYRPENQEQWPIHPSYSYAYVTDKFEGLIVVDVMTLVDGNPRNNFLKRAVTFNPSGVLNGAVNIAIGGNYAYILCDVGLVVVSIADPLQPKVVGGIRAPELKKPKAIAIQFRYAFVCDEEGVKAIDITDPEKPRLVPNNVVRLNETHDIYVARTYAYVAAGPQGLAIIDVENPEAMKLDQTFNAEGAMNDVHGVKVAATNASIFAYVADGKNGLRILQLTSPGHTPTYLGFSPRPVPILIATHKGHGEAIAVSKGMDRDRAVDESGNQVSIFGRLGSRPFTLDEQHKFFMRNGKVWTVSDDGKVSNLDKSSGGRAVGSK